MKITVRESTMVRPSSETPQHGLWISKLDRASFRGHVPTAYFYRHNGSKNLFNTKVMKQSLGRALDLFYPTAGRLRRSKDGELEIDCNGHGVLFVEADVEGKVDDFGDFSPAMELRQLIPKADYQNQDISSYPLLMVQVTFFKCGGVCLGAGVHHTVVDGPAAIYFLNSWSDLARGMDVTCPPIIDRSLLRARSPPQPAFKHPEYQTFSPLEPKISPNITSEGRQMPEKAQLSGAIFKFSTDQLAKLKKKAKEGDNNNVEYTTFESLSAHIWRCVSLARCLDDVQQTKLFVAVDGRRRFRPEIPNHYFGNVNFNIPVELVSGDLNLRPMHYAASKIRDMISRLDDNYLRSSLDCLELLPDLGELIGTEVKFGRSMDLRIVSWTRMPIYDADFGWGKPYHMGPVNATVDGLGYILPSPSNDGTVSVVMSLAYDAMCALKKLIYDI